MRSFTQAWEVVAVEPRTIEKLKDVSVFRRSEDGKIGGIKGTMITLLEHDSQRLVEKLWLLGDWVFTADYEYQVEKRIYQAAGALGLPVPKLLDYDDKHRMLRTEYLPGERPQTPCRDRSLLQTVLRFFDEFRNIDFPEGPQLHSIGGPRMHQHRVDQLQFGNPDEKDWRALKLYESFLTNATCCTAPFDRILHNAVLRDDGLFFYDFEWTFAAPHEFTLARTAVEFNCYDDPDILSRVQDLDLYHLFVLHFYQHGRETETIHRYMRQQALRDARLCELFDIITAKLRT
jgi:hypothetical protein